MILVLSFLCVAADDVADAASCSRTGILTSYLSLRRIAQLHLRQLRLRAQSPVFSQLRRKRARAAHGRKPCAALSKKSELNA
jgi:hypothetical protein